MFGLSMVEIAIVAILALLLLGPDQLPGMAKTLGKTLRDLRRATDDLKGTFETEMNKLEREVEQAQQEPPKPAAGAPSASAAYETPALMSGFPGATAPPGPPEPAASEALPVPLDQLHQSAGDPGAMRARARLSAVPKDPGSARSAARFAAHAQQLAASGAPPAPAPAPAPAPTPAPGESEPGQP